MAAKGVLNLCKFALAEKGKGDPQEDLSYVMEKNGGGDRNRTDE